MDATLTNSPGRPGSSPRTTDRTGRTADRTPDRRASSRWLLFSAGSTALSLLVVGPVLAEWPPVLRLDRHVADSLHAQALAHPGWTAANRILTDWVWDPWTMRLLLAAAVVWLWRRRARRLACWAAATGLLASAVQQLLKAVIGRERPEWEHPVDSASYAAMPSGHAMTLAVACVVVLWLSHSSGAPRRVRWPGFAVAGVSVVGVCMTRVALGVHWLTDTVAGVLLGFAVAAASVAAWHAWGPRRRPAGRGGAR